MPSAAVQDLSCRNAAPQGLLSGWLLQSLACGCRCYGIATRLAAGAQIHMVVGSFVSLSSVAQSVKQVHSVHGAYVLVHDSTVLLITWK